MLLELQGGGKRGLGAGADGLGDDLAILHQHQRGDAERLERMTYGAKAMRDSSLIYLSYAKYIASGMPESPDLVEEDLQG